MTEDQAREKWCPMTAPLTVNGTYPIPGNQKCIASDCMMWRYHDTSINGMEDGDGHCGLAGKP